MKRLTYNIEAYQNHQESRAKDVYIFKDEYQHILKTISRLKDMLENEEIICNKKFDNVVVNRMTVMEDLNSIGRIITNK